ncbi:hypothetical protein [Roseateles aquatilis]|nr:hypothetical protein [Roseateles aquatilis]
MNRPIAGSSREDLTSSWEDLGAAGVTRRDSLSEQAMSDFLDGLRARGDGGVTYARAQAPDFEDEVEVDAPEEVMRRPAHRQEVAVATRRHGVVVEDNSRRQPSIDASSGSSAANVESAGVVADRPAADRVLLPNIDALRHAEETHGVWAPGAKGSGDRTFRQSVACLLKDMSVMCAKAPTRWRPGAQGKAMLATLRTHFAPLSSVLREDYRQRHEQAGDLYRARESSLVERVLREHLAVGLGTVAPTEGVAMHMRAHLQLARTALLGANRPSQRRHDEMADERETLMFAIDALSDVLGRYTGASVAHPAPAR